MGNLLSQLRTDLPAFTRMLVPERSTLKPRPWRRSGQAFTPGAPMSETTRLGPAVPSSMQLAASARYIKKASRKARGGHRRRGRPGRARQRYFGSPRSSASRSPVDTRARRKSSARLLDSSPTRRGRRDPHCNDTLRLAAAGSRRRSALARKSRVACGPADRLNGGPFN